MAAPPKPALLKSGSVKKGASARWDEENLSHNEQIKVGAPLLVPLLRPMRGAGVLLL